MQRLGRTIAAARVDHHRARAAGHRDFRAHAIGPEAVDEARLQGLGRGDAEILVLAEEGAGHRPDLHLVALDVDARFDQQLLEAEIDQRRGADVEPLDGVDVALPGAEIGAQDQEPVHVLRLRGDELAALPAGEGEGRAVRRAANEINAAVAQNLQRLVDGEDQFQRHVETLGLEEAEFDRGGDREIGIGDQIGNGDFHGTLCVMGRKGG